MSKNYNIIAFEGLDCSFKETNCKAFVNYAKYAVEGGTTIITESFPRYENESSIFVRKWLDGKSFDRDFLKKHSMAVDSFYSIDRFSYWYDRTDHNGYSIMDIMKQNPNIFYTFIFDRYNISNAIFNPIYTGVDIRDLTFDRDVYGIPLPDTVVWMRMKSFDVLKSLIAEKSNKDANEMDIDFLYKIWSRSEDMIKSDIFDQLGIRLVVVDCLNEDLTIKTKDEIFNFITNNVKIR